MFQNNWECYAGGAVIDARGFVYRGPGNKREYFGRTISRLRRRVRQSRNNGRDTGGRGNSAVLQLPNPTSNTNVRNAKRGTKEPKKKGCTRE